MTNEAKLQARKWIVRAALVLASAAATAIGVTANWSWRASAALTQSDFRLAALEAGQDAGETDRVEIRRALALYQADQAKLFAEFTNLTSLAQARIITEIGELRIELARQGTDIKWIVADRKRETSWTGDAP